MGMESHGGPPTNLDWFSSRVLMSTVVLSDPEADQSSEWRVQCGESSRPAGLSTPPSPTVPTGPTYLNSLRFHEGVS
jgi:hypothetical protein